MTMDDGDNRGMPFQGPFKTIASRRQAAKASTRTGTEISCVLGTLTSGARGSCFQSRCQSGCSKTKFSKLRLQKINCLPKKTGRPNPLGTRLHIVQTLKRARQVPLWLSSQKCFRPQWKQGSPNWLRQSRVLKIALPLAPHRRPPPHFLL